MAEPVTQELLNSIFALADDAKLNLPGARVLGPILSKDEAQLSREERVIVDSVQKLIDKADQSTFQRVLDIANPFTEAGTFNVGPIKVSGPLAAVALGLVAAPAAGVGLATGVGGSALGALGIRGAAGALASTVGRAGQALSPRVAQAVPRVARGAGRGAAVGAGTEVARGAITGEGLPSVENLLAAAAGGAVGGGGAAALGGGGLVQAGVAGLGAFTGSALAQQGDVEQIADIFQDPQAAEAFQNLTPLQKEAFGQRMAEFEAGLGGPADPIDRVGLLEAFIRDELGGFGGSAVGDERLQTGGGLPDSVPGGGPPPEVPGTTPDGATVEPVTLPDGTILGHIITSRGGVEEFVPAGTSQADVRGFAEGQAEAGRGFAETQAEAGRQFQTELETQRQTFAEQQAQFQADLQRQLASIPLFQQLLEIQSSPSARLRFVARQAESAGEETIPFNISEQLASFFGLEAGAALPIGGDEPLTTVPNVGQLGGLTGAETGELDALADILFGQSFEEIQRRSRELAPPGGRRLFVQ